MDYVVGGVAALVSGNVTPNRPRIVKRALTPTKHPASPNVTPKSEYVEDRSIFLSPTMQKKKAIVKKSPKRIFQNQDLDATLDGETVVGPQADKVKKHLKGDLDTSSQLNETIISQRTPKKKRGKSHITSSALENTTEKGERGELDLISQLEITADSQNTPKKKRGIIQTPSKTNNTTEDSEQGDIVSSPQPSEINSSHKKNKKKRSKSQTPSKVDTTEEVEPSPKKPKKLSTSFSEDTSVPHEASHAESVAPAATEVKKSPKKRNNKNKVEANVSAEKIDTDEQDPEGNTTTNNGSLALTPDKSLSKSQKRRNRKKKKSLQKNGIAMEQIKSIKQKPTPAKKNKNPENPQELVAPDPVKKGNTTQPLPEPVTEIKAIKKLKILVNPNAITEKDSESEHESDDDLESDDDEDDDDDDEGDESKDEDNSDTETENNSDAANKEETPKADGEVPESSEDEEEKKEGKKQEVKDHTPTEEELKRTLFVGNVPFSGKAKKDIKRIFSKYGQIQTVRIRSIPIKDSRDTPKLAVIKNELHPDRTTVNVYVKFAEHEHREMALAENGTVLNKCHLRVTRADTTGAEHDHNLAVYIGNMPFALEDEALRARFEKCGEIESVRIVRDRKTNVGKGFGYVNFKSRDGVELALALTEEDLTFKNRILRVQRCMQGVGRGPRATGGRGAASRGGQIDGPGRGRGSDRGFRGSGRGFGPVRGRGGHRGGFDQGPSSTGRGGHRGGFDQGSGRGRGGFGQDTSSRGFGRGRGGFGPGRGGRGGGRDFGPPRGRGRGAGGFRGERHGGGVVEDGAVRRLNKRRNEEGGSEGPSPKAPRSDQSQQPPREKKERKEFVGMTSEKKKKQKFSKDQKHKKALSEILTK